MTAALVAAIEPSLGETWIKHAASIASTATRSRQGLFFIELARGLRGFDKPQDALNDMQSIAARLLAWFDDNGGRERFGGRKPRPKAPPEPPPPAADVEPIAEDSEIASALRAALANKVGAERAALWFGPRTGIDWDGQILTIWTPNQFFLDWIRSNFRAAIEETCSTILGSPVTPQFRIQGTDAH